MSRPKTQPHWTIALALSLSLAACTSATLEDGTAASSLARDEPQASIAFANQGGIRNWQPLDDRTLLIEGSGGQWYLARLQSPSTDLAFAEQVGFDGGPSGTLARLGAVIVKGLRYPIVSLTPTDPPAKKKSAAGSR